VTKAITFLKKDGYFTDSETPAMLFLDLKMPRMAGMQFLAWMQTQPKPDFPIIVLSGLQDLRQMKEAYQLGAHSFLMKPLEQNDFAAFIDKFKGIEIGI